MMSRLNILTSILLLSITSCIEQYGLESQGNHETKIVVNGRITNSPSENFVTITQATPFTNENQVVPKGISTANVYVMDWTEERAIPFFHLGSGRYIPPNDFIGLEHHEYQLFLTFKGQRYESSRVSFEENLMLDQLNFEFEERQAINELGNVVPLKGFNMEVGYATSGVTDNDRFVRFVADVTYSRPQGVSSCYNSISLGYIDVLDLRSEPTSAAHALRFLARNDRYYGSRFYYGLRAYSMDVEAKDYWEAIENQQNQGSIFDPIPGTPPGNISSTMEDGTNILGLFEAAAVQEIGIFIERSDQPGAGLPLTTSECQSTVTPDFWIGVPDSIPSQIVEAINLAEQHSINKYQINWVLARERIYEAYSNDGFEAAIVMLLTILDDDHSGYRILNGENIFLSDLVCEPANFDFENLPTDVGYIKIRQSTGGMETLTAYAEEVQEQIRSQDNPDISGWIVDISGNRGGDAWSMIAGLGPMWTEQKLGYFINADGVETTWGYSNDGFFIDNPDRPVLTVENPYETLDLNKKVAVIMDNQTNSAGETVAIAFKGRPASTRFFGQGTCGRSTGNITFTLSNGDQFYVASVVTADRNKNIYRESVYPDEYFDDGGALKDRVIEWLRE